MYRPGLLFLTICLVGVLSPEAAFAANPKEFPLLFVLSQIGNFTLFALVLFFILKKVAPRFFKQKRDDFLAYQKKALKLEKEYQDDCLALQTKIDHIEEQKRNVHPSAKSASESLKQELAKQSAEHIKNLKIRAEQELKRANLKAINDLKTGLISEVMGKTYQRIKVHKNLHILDSQIIHKWEQNHD